MAVTHRLRELRTAGKHEQADTLAVEALRNERPTVTMAVDHVRVETKTFVGEHALDRSVEPVDEASLRKALARRGTYALGEEVDGRTFTTGCLYDAVVEELLEAQSAETGETETDVADDEPVGVDAGGSVGAEVETDDVAPVGPASPDRSPTSVIRQAVAAVQSQFRD